MEKNTKTIALTRRVFTEIAKNKNAQGFDENKFVAQEGGTVAGKARKDLEKKSGKKVSTGENYLLKPEDRKRL
ncbi:MAG: hypothetical protein V1732_05645 [Patescibacteria group bacterium]